MLAAVGVGAAAFLLYRATLLPGLDFGDTASFQVVAGLPTISTRDAYPLYFAIGAVLCRMIGGDPAHALNLASAIESAAACGVLTLVAAELSGSIVAGAGAALLLAGSYTLWSQSVIAEVYGLHMLCVVLSVWLLLRWSARPTDTRLAAFFAAYALGFGNHLSMILLAPAIVFFLLASAPQGWGSLFRPRIVAMAIAFAVAGALQYAWNLRSLWFAARPPSGLLDALAQGWFDVTKADWRATMVLNVPPALLRDHFAMYAFDLWQQIGWTGVALAAVGAVAVLAREWRVAVLLLGIYLANALFAFSYDVGDTHVFYLPSHMIVALLTAPGVVAVAAAGRSAPRPRHRARLVAGFLLVAYAGVRIYRDYPALDRSADRRPTEALDRVTEGIDDRRAILLTDLNWQVQNGLNYYGSRLHSEVAFARMPEVLLYAPALIGDNLAVGRRVVLTPRAHAALAAAYGPLVPTAPDPEARVASLSDQVGSLPAGTRYVLTVLKPTREFTLDPDDLARAIGALTGGRLAAVPPGDYAAIAGVVGRAPAAVVGLPTPFRRTTAVDGTRVEIRMDSWLSADTIRRMGFGHVIAGRRHALIVERGVSFVALDRSGQPIASAYAANLFAPQPRYVCYPR